MFEILAQGTAESIGIAAGAAVLVLTGGKGLDALMERRKSSNGKHAWSEKDCDRRHAEEAKYRALETSNLVKSIDAINASVTRLHERFDDILRERAEK